MSFETGDLIVDEQYDEVWVVTAKNVSDPKGPSYEKFYWRLDFLYSLNKNINKPHNKTTRYTVPKIIEREFIAISELNTDRT